MNDKLHHFSPSYIESVRGWEELIDTNKENATVLGIGFIEEGIRKQAIEPNWSVVLSPPVLYESHRFQLEQDLTRMSEIIELVFESISQGDDIAVLHTLGCDIKAANYLRLKQKKTGTDGISRFDVLWDVTGPKVIELNVGSCTGGFNVSDLSSAYFFLNENSEVRSGQNEVLPDSMGMLGKHVTNIAKKEGFHTVAILDDKRFFSEASASLHRYAQAFQENGIERAFACTVQELTEGNDGGLYYGDIRVDAFYR